jgi:hypothetical protein
MMRFILLALCLCSWLQAASPLKERIGKAKSGDYIVAEAGKMVTLLSIRQVSDHSIVLEEISVPSQNLKKRPSSWAEWIRAKAPGHTSWSMVEIDTQGGQIIECYSFSKGAWIQLGSQESLFATLLQLPLQPLSLESRKKIGPPPPDGEKDLRKVWEPPLIFEGVKQGQVHFDAFQTVWPKDGSELSGKAILIYLDRNLGFPFPFWISVETTHALATFRVIDAGKNLPSPYRNLPRRIPQFVGQPQKTKEGLRLSLKSPKYYRDFELFAVDVTTREKQIYPISHSLVLGEDEFLHIEIDEEHLRKVLEPDHRYTWLIVPQGHTESYTETLKPFLWTDKPPSR